MKLQVFNAAVQRLLGRYCAVCQRGSDAPLCNNCLQSITNPQCVCKVCGCELSAASAGSRCKQCIEMPPAFESFYSIGTYHGKLAELIVAAKIAKQVAAIGALRYLLQHYIYNDRETINYFNRYKDYALLAVPSPRSRLMNRGFNLPLWIAKDIGRHYQIPVLPSKTITLPFFSHKQSVLTKQQRQGKRHHYQINHKTPKNILIIDDVFTTGETARELALCLRSNGAENIGVYAISRGQMID